MVKNLSKITPLSGNKRSHACNATKTKQKPNYQTKKIDGVKVKLAASEWKTYNKSDKKAA